MSTGYANRIIHLAFPELVPPKLDGKGQPVQAKDEDGNPKHDDEGNPVWEPSENIWVSMRNPQLMPPAELQPRDVPLDDNGQPQNPEDANTVMFEIFAKLIIGWRAYDANDYQIDPDTGEALDQQLISMPVTIEGVKKLPTAIINKISETMVATQNPN